MMGVFLFVILIAVFAVQNAGPVSIKFLFWTVPGIPLVLVIFGTAFCGFVIGVLLGRLPKKGRAKELSSKSFSSK
ncbi:MAG TPA: LapA family protein [Syntrophomonadaceae bacterium]|nr:LapA family protein [Syntrophomonadaceae bacterium]